MAAIPALVIPFAPLPCPACASVLIVCQPSPREPNKLLGACHKCYAWWPITANGGDPKLAPESWAIGDRLDGWPESHAPDRTQPDD